MTANSHEDYESCRMVLRALLRGFQVGVRAWNEESRELLDSAEFEPRHDGASQIRWSPIKRSAFSIRLSVLVACHSSMLGYIKSFQVGSESTWV